MLEWISYKTESVLIKLEQKPWEFESFCVSVGQMECHIALSNAHDQTTWLCEAQL